MGFPPKEFYTVDELASRWDTPPLKIIEWAMGRKIELVVALPEAEFEDGQEAEFAAVRASQVRPLFRSYADAERSVLICRATPPGADAPLRIVKPPDGARIMAADVMAVLAEVERFEEENELVRRVVVGPGAPTRHNWERFYVNSAFAFTSTACPRPRRSWSRTWRIGSWTIRTGVSHPILRQSARKSKWYGKGSSPNSLTPAQRRPDRRNSPDLSAGFRLCAG